jgi:hypothetical protein
MAAEIVCDGCGRRAPMIAVGRDWRKPRDWFERSDKIAAASGKTSVVLPL